MYFGVINASVPALMSVFDYSEEVAQKVATNFANRTIGGNMGVMLRDLITGTLSSPASVTTDIVVKALAIPLAAGFGMISKDGNLTNRTKQALFDFVAATLKPFGITPTADVISMALSDKTVLANIANTMGVINTVNQTNFGLDNGTRTNSWQEATAKMF